MNWSCMVALYTNRVNCVTCDFVNWCAYAYAKYNNMMALSGCCAFRRIFTLVISCSAWNLCACVWVRVSVIWSKSILLSPNRCVYVTHVCVLYVLLCEAVHKRNMRPTYCSKCDTTNNQHAKYFIFKHTIGWILNTAYVCINCAILALASETGKSPNKVCVRKLYVAVPMRFYASIYYQYFTHEIRQRR